MIRQIAETDEEYRRLLTVWESDSEGRLFREDVVGERFSDRIGREDRIFADAARVLDRLIDNMVKAVRRDLDEEKVTLWMFNRIEGDRLVFDPESVRKVAKNALFRHYEYFSSVSDAISEKKLDQIVEETVKNDHRISEGFDLPGFYLKTIGGGEK